MHQAMPEPRANKSATQLYWPRGSQLYSEYDVDGVLEYAGQGGHHVHSKTPNLTESTHVCHAKRMRQKTFVRIV